MGKFQEDKFYSDAAYEAEPGHVEPLGPSGIPSYDDRDVFGREENHDVSRQLP